MPEKFTERPAIGTRVYLEGRPGIWSRIVQNQAGRVYRHGGSGDIVWVRFDNGEIDYGEWRELRPEAPEAADPTPEAVIIGGKRYVLAEPTAEAPEVKREPKQGEIWRDGSALYQICLVGDGEGYLAAIHLRSGNRYSSHKRFPFAGNSKNFVFAYPNLAAAIEAGETFK